MIGDVVGELAGGVLKFIGRLLLEVVFEFLIKGAGYVLCRPFSRRKLDPDGGLVVVVGLAFWIVVGAGIYALKSQLWLAQQHAGSDSQRRCAFARGTA